MTISAEERHLIQETLRIAEQGTTHMVPEVMYNPTTKYTDPNQYEAEVNTLFRNFPIIIGHVSDLAEAGDFMTHDHFGVPIVVTRAQDGVSGIFERVPPPWGEINERTLWQGAHAVLPVPCLDLWVGWQIAGYPPTIWL